MLRTLARTLAEGQSFAVPMRPHEVENGQARRLPGLAADLVVFVLGCAISLAGDACHVAVGMTRYTWPGVPTIWRSAIWFPLLVGGSIVATARVGALLALPRRRRTRVDAVLAIAAVLALHALTAVLRGQPSTVSITLCTALAVMIWAWWDPSSRTFVVACVGAVLGPLVEIGFVSLGAVSYATDSRALAGVAPSLPCLYFAAAAVTSGLRSAVADDGTAAHIAAS